MSALKRVGECRVDSCKDAVSNGVGSMMDEGTADSGGSLMDCGDSMVGFSGKSAGTSSISSVFGMGCTLRWLDGSTGVLTSPGVLAPD